MILDDLVAATKRRLAHEQAQAPLATVQLAATATPAPNPVDTLRRFQTPGLHLIGEVKRASPSKGLIAPDFDYRQIARDYQAAGVDAISVLTEPDYFQGQLQYLQEIAGEVTVPVLRKDFIIDPYMIYQARAAGASLVLLIVAILTPQQLQAYCQLALSLGLVPLVECHDADEITTALAAKAPLIGINNRNLKTFHVDVTMSQRLRPLIPADVPVIAESGLATPQQIQQLATAGLNGVLIGETLMRAPDKRAAVALLKGGLAHDPD